MELIRSSVKRTFHIGLALSLAGSLVLTGCQVLPVPGTTTPVTGPSSSVTSVPGNTSQPAVSTPASTPGSMPGNSSLPAAGIGRQALEKYRQARSELASETMSHYWSVESNYPLKTGLFHRAVNYRLGQITTGWGAVEESSGVEVRRSFWYRTAADYAVVADGTLKRYPASQVRAADPYDLDGLMERVLSDFSVSRESGTFYVKLNTQSEPLIRELMEDLGYRKTEKAAYEGSLYLEALLDETTGHLRTLNYVFTQRVAGYKDNGSILLGEFDEPVTVVIPDETNLPTAIDALDLEPGQP